MNPDHTEVVASSVLLRGRDSIHLARTADGYYQLRVAGGTGCISFDPAAAQQLWRDLDANLLLDEAGSRLQPGETIDQVTPSTAEFLREDAARDAAWDEARQ